MITVIRAEPFTNIVAGHGEGPVWDERSGRLLSVDLFEGDVLATTRDGNTRKHHIAEVAAALRPRVRGGYVMGIDRGFALLDDSLVVKRRLDDLWDDSGVRMNEGGCDPWGRFYCGSMAFDAEPGAGTLYRLGTDLTTQTVRTGVTISNGLEWSPSGDRAYYVDTPTQSVEIITVGQDRELGPTLERIDIHPDYGSPDGIALDADDGLWVALWGGGAVHRYSATGALTTVVEVPTPHVTACTFGGPYLSTLFITTSRHGRADDGEAGRIFACTPGQHGLPTRHFTG